jgi:hypothetical protein
MQLETLVANFYKIYLIIEGVNTMSVMDFGADSDEIKSVKFKSFKGKAGETVRAAFIYEDPKKMFKGAQIHYNNRYFICKSDGKKKEICCTHNYKGNKPKWRVGGVIVQYTMSDDGKKLNDWNVPPWIFSETMYAKLKTSNQEFPLISHDVMLTCTNEDFQTIDVQSCKISLWQSNDALKGKILEAARPYLDEVADNIASDLTPTEIRELMGADTPGSDDAAEDVNLDDVVDGLE